MGKKRVEFLKPSLRATNQRVSIPVSALDRMKLRSIAVERGVAVEEILRECVTRVIAEHRKFKAEIVKF